MIAPSKNPGRSARPAVPFTLPRCSAGRPSARSAAVALSSRGKLGGLSPLKSRPLAADRARRSRCLRAVPAAALSEEKLRVVVVGNGMVGLNFLEKMAKSDELGAYKLVTFAEEDRPAYHRMNMTQYFDHRDASQLELAPSSWYTENDIELHVGDRVTGIDRERKVVHSQNGKEITYDKLILATGSTAFFPPIPGILPG